MGKTLAAEATIQNLFVTIRVPETLPQEVLTKMHASPKPDYEEITPDQLATFDAFLFGIPTRYGNFPAQWKVRSAISRGEQLLRDL